MKKENVSPFPIGNINPVSQYFIGKSYYCTLTSDQAQTDISNVTFEVNRYWCVLEEKAGIRNGEKIRF